MAVNTTTTIPAIPAANNPAVKQTIEVNAQGGAGTTLVQNQSATNIVNNNYISSTVSTTPSSGAPAAATPPAKPQPEAPKLKIPVLEILPAADPKEVDDIIKTGKFELNQTWGVSLVDIEAKERQRMKLEAAQKAAEAAKPKTDATKPDAKDGAEQKKPEVKGEAKKDGATDNKNPSKEPIIIHSVPAMDAKTLPLTSFTQKQQTQFGRMLGLDEEQQDFQKTLSKALEDNKLSKNGQIDAIELVKFSQGRWQGTGGKTLESLGENEKKYIQTMLGVPDDGDIGPETLKAAKEKGILQEDGKINEKSVLTIIQNRLVGKDGAYLADIVNDIAKNGKGKDVDSTKTSSINGGFGDSLSNLVAGATKNLTTGVAVSDSKTAIIAENVGGQKSASPNKER